MIRPTLIQCFPHPFTRQWPSTGNSVTCECRQLYALVSVCCCVPNTHLLVLHEAALVSTNMITSMPKGPKYVDYRITSRTTAEDFCGFLMRAEMAAGSVAASHAANVPDEGSAFLRAADNFHLGASTNLASTTEATNLGASLSYAPMRRIDSATSALARSASHSTLPQRQVVVVCLHGIAEASAPVQSALMDVLCFEQVRSHHRAMRVPTLRVVAFCFCRNFALLVPETLRAAFTLSTYVSALSCDSAVVLQTNNTATSNIVNKRFMLEVMTSPDGQSLLETVTLSASVQRYMRHLLLVVRGSFCSTISPGALALRRLPKWAAILRAFAVLFMPDEELLRSRSMHLRPSLLHSYTTRASTMLMSGDRNPYSASHRAAASASNRLGGSELKASGSITPQSLPHVLQPASAATANRRHNVIPFEETEETEEAAVEPSKIESFSNVVVSPSDVACVLSCLLAHLMTIPREMVPREDVMTAASTMMGNVAGTGSVVDAYVNALDAHRRGPRGYSFQDPTTWDAVAASWSVRQLRGIASGMVDSIDNNFSGSFISPTLLHGSPVTNFNGTFNSAKQGDRGGDGRSGGSYAARPAIAAQESMVLGGTPATRQSYFDTLNNRPLSSIADVWKSGATERLGILDVSFIPLLDYWEVREVIRATLICRSAAAPA